MKKDKFEVENTVYCVMFGKGVVDNIDEEEYYPVTVTFENGREESYTSNGEYYANSNRTLFFEEIPIPESAYVKPKWRAEKGNKYFLINSIGDIYNTIDNYYEVDDLHFEKGNYFQTEEEGKESKFYKVFHE